MKIEDLIDNEEIRHKIKNITESDVVVLPDLECIPQDESFMPEAYAIILCERGMGSCNLGDREIRLQKNDLVIIQHQQFISNVMTSSDFKGQGLIMSATFLESIFLLTGKFWPAKFIVKTAPVFHLTDEEMKVCQDNNNFLRLKLTKTHSEHYHEMMHALLHSMIFDFYDLVSPKIQFPNYSYTSAESIFSRFMKMAESETPRHRDVGYYADRLCITPKYLSVVCKQSSGRTASDILNKMTIEYIKNMLRSSDKSVKEIANAAGFDNLSFFGKYVRRELGVSPREYRAKI